MSTPEVERLREDVARALSKWSRARARAEWAQRAAFVAGARHWKALARLAAAESQESLIEGLDK